MQVGLAFLPGNPIMAVFSLGLSAKLVMRFGIRGPLAWGWRWRPWGWRLFAARAHRRLLHATCCLRWCCWAIPCCWPP